MACHFVCSQDYKAKLADFGLAKDGPVGDKTHVTTQVVGTHGYADPDYIITGTPKAHDTAGLDGWLLVQGHPELIDVYGFGVLMLILKAGRQASVCVMDDYYCSLLRFSSLVFFCNSGHSTPKSDVYGSRMLVLEIVTRCQASVCVICITATVHFCTCYSCPLPLFRPLDTQE